MFGVNPAAGIPSLTGRFSQPLLSRVHPRGPVQPRVLGSRRPPNQEEQSSAAGAALAVGALVVSSRPPHRGRPLHMRSFGATERTPLPAPSTLDELKLQLENKAIVEPEIVARIFSDHISQIFNNHPLIAQLRDILNDLNNDQISEEERQEIEALLIEATREMGFGFPDLCNELWNECHILKQFPGIDKAIAFELFSSHFGEDQSHSGTFFKPASEQLPPKSLSDYVRDTIYAQPTDRPLIKVFLEAMRLGSQPKPNLLALYLVVEDLEKSGAPFFSLTSQIAPKNPFLGEGHKAKEDGHAIVNREIEEEFLEARPGQEDLLGQLGFRQLRDPEAQLEALKVGKRTGDAMAKYLDGIHERLKALRQSQVDRRSAESAVSEGAQPQSDTQASSPTPEQVLTGVKVLNALAGILNIMTSKFEIELEDNPDSPAHTKINVLLDKHKALGKLIIALSESIGECYPELIDHPIKQFKFFTEDGKKERYKVLGDLRNWAVANTEKDAQHAISEFYELMIKELGDIKSQLNNDKSLESVELITKINQQIAELIDQINEIKGTIEVSN